LTSNFSSPKSKINRSFNIFIEIKKAGDLSNQIKEMKISNKNFDPELIYNWTFQMIKAMNYLHSNFIIHRDIKPKYDY